MRSLHPTAIVESRAELGDDVVVGPYAIVEGRVRLGSGCVLHAHAVVRGATTLGPRNVVHPFAVVGGEPQDKRHVGQEALVEAGEGNVFREHVTVHGGTEGGVTRIGTANLFMVGAHVGHDAAVGSNCVLANGVLLAGHARVEDWVTFGGLSGVTQHVRVGESAFVAANSACERDVPPFVVVDGHRARVRALNVVGLRRRGVSEESIRALRLAVRKLWLSAATREQALRELEDQPDPLVRRLVASLQAERR